MREEERDIEGERDREVGLRGDVTNRADKPQRVNRQYHIDDSFDNE